jgi:hypothetical protein
VTRVRFAILYVLAWVPLAALYALVLGTRPGMDVFSTVMATIWTIGSAALLGAGVWWLSNPLQFRRKHPARFHVNHPLLANVYGTLHTAEIAVSIYYRGSKEQYDTFMREALGWQVLYGIALYGLIVGISYALQSARRLRDEERRGARAEALRIDAELRALRAQLNPHFLFNTLHSITALVRIDPADGERALEHFGALLRYVLDVNRERSEEVPLEEELGFVRTYLALERLRLGDRLQVKEEIDPDALECLVLGFSLQPLVENAIRHGIAPRSGPGTLRISANLDGEQLVLEVADDGSGADGAAVAEAAGVGLSAVRQRLETRWGPQARLEIVTAPRNGFLVRLVLPAVTTPVLRARTGELRLPSRADAVAR